MKVIGFNFVAMEMQQLHRDPECNENPEWIRMWSIMIKQWSHNSTSRLLIRDYKHNSSRGLNNKELVELVCPGHTRLIL